jgi:hypothetical protein
MRISDTRVTVVGRVVRVRRRRDGGWRVRLAETGGALGAAEIRPPSYMPLPKRGRRILIRGVIRYNSDHGWYAVDPVDEWLDAGGA